MIHTQESLIGRLIYPGEIRRYVLGGNSTFTLRHTESSRRHTYKVKSATVDRDKNWSTGNQNRDLYFVSVLRGQDNESSYEYMGILRKRPTDGDYWFDYTAKSRFKPGSEVFDVFAQFWRLLDQGCRIAPWMEFWHEGQCCMCGRKLTVPESVAAGIGPECASKTEG